MGPWRRASRRAVWSGAPRTATRKGVARALVSPSRRGAFARCAAPVLFAALLGSCGRKATVADCEGIVKRVVELELKARAPAEDIAAEVRETQEALRDRALTSCVGRRITDSAIECTEKAQSAAELIDTCLN